MKYSIQINQAVIFENDWHKSSDLTTWALFDFLCFFNNADGHRTLNDGEFKWVNYKYITESLPLCDFYNQKIKKHLDILASFGLIALKKDNANNIYFKLLPKHKILFEINYHPRENFTNPLVKNYQPPRENFTYNNNKESISKNNNNNFTPYIPQSEIQEEVQEESSLKSKKNKVEYTAEFESFYNAYPRKINKLLAFNTWKRVIKTQSIDALIAKAKEYAEYCKANQTDDTYIAHPSTWLNKSYFENDYKSMMPQGYKHKQAVMQRGLSDWGCDDDDNEFF